MYLLAKCRFFSLYDMFSIIINRLLPAHFHVLGNLYKPCLCKQKTAEFCRTYNVITVLRQIFNVPNVK